MYGPMSRADALLKKLDTQSNDAKFSLNHEASWIAENNSPDAAMVFLSKIGLDKPSSITAYESYVDGWVNRKQPEKALALLSKNADARNFYLATVLKSRTQILIKPPLFIMKITLIKLLFLILN